MGQQHADEQDWSDKTVFSTGEAAMLCNVSQQTIIRCFDSGRLQGFRVPGSKFRRIPREELIRFMRENGIPLAPIEGAVRRVLCIHHEPSPLASLNHGIGDKLRLDIRTTTNAYDAGLLTVRFRPHLILLDDRVESVPLPLVCKRAREAGGPDGPRVVSVGRFRDEADRRSRIRDGADAVIPLPIDPDRLVDVVINLLSARGEGGADG